MHGASHLGWIGGRGPTVAGNAGSEAERKRVDAQ